MQEVSTNLNVYIQMELMNNTELVQSYRQQINNTINQFNLQLFWNMYNRWVNMNTGRKVQSHYINFLFLLFSVGGI